LQPKIYTASEHKILKSQIDPDALTVVETLIRAGHKAYLVGGCVRDLLLGQIPKDFDVSTSALPEEIKPLFRRCFLIGRRFRLAHVQFGRKIIEVSTFRKGDNENESLILRDNDWGDEAEDVIRRDFTINGLFYHPDEETVIDYVNGFEDAKKRTLCCIGSPFVRFKQDPVRMIRLLKFRARFGFAIDNEAIKALVECRKDILKSSPPRVLEEFLRMLELGTSERFIKLLAECGFLTILVPGVSSFLEKPPGKEIYNFLKHVDAIHRKGEPTFSRSVLLSCFVFPILRTHLQALHRQKTMHLGEIQEEARFIVDETFGPFFQIPKKIAAVMVSLLTSQFRFTPLIEKKTPRNPKIPASDEFALALDFLRLRALEEPELAKLYEEWNYFWRKKEKQRKVSSERVRTQ